MAGAFHRQQAEINMEYVNQPSPTRNHSDKQTNVYPGEKLIRVVAVSFGLLCVLQAAVSITLRLVLYTQTSGLLRVCKNGTTDINNFRRQNAQYFQQGWMYVHPSFYYVSSTQKSWEDSQQDCFQRDADLVIINTKEEQTFARQLFRLTWIGLRNITGTDQWTWVDGTPLTESYWDDGEPNNLLRVDNNCVEIRLFEQENSWNDRPCINQNFWICEKNLTQIIK